MSTKDGTVCWQCLQAKERKECPLCWCWLCTECFGPGAGCRVCYERIDAKLATAEGRQA